MNILGLEYLAIVVWRNLKRIVTLLFMKYTRIKSGFVAILVLSILALAKLDVFAADQSQLIGALQQGGYVVYMRHGDTTGEPLDRTRDLTNRALQRNLSEAGRAQATAIGEAIRRLELKVGHVATSPVFRTRDTAELAFGVDQVEVDPWLIADDYASGGYQEYIVKLREYLATPPEEGNTWLIGHVIPIAMATSSEVDRRNFPEGAAAVFKPGNTEYELIGILDAGWQEITRSD